MTDRLLQDVKSDVRFVVKCNNAGYKFGYVELVGKSRSGGSEEVQWMGEVSNRIMTRDPPTGMPFTGMMLGLYAFGELQKCFEPADFKYAAFG